MLAGASRVVNIVAKRATAHSRRSRILQIVTLPTMVALALGIFGATDEASSNTSDIQNGKTLMKSVIIMFLMIYLLVLALVVITMKDFSTAPQGEKRIYLAVLSALPFLAVRLLYSILAAFTSNEDFSIFNGKPLVKLFMAIVEEFIVVCFYTIVGLTANEVQVRHEGQVRSGGHRRRGGHVRQSNLRR
jgi:K+-sensing histidine kinase KdpD